MILRTRLVTACLSDVYATVDRPRSGATADSPPRPSSEIDHRLFIFNTLLIRILEEIRAVVVEISKVEISKRFGIVADQPQLERAQSTRPLSGWAEQLAQLVKVDACAGDVAASRLAQDPLGVPVRLR